MREYSTPVAAPAFSVCVYCGSKPGLSQLHTDHARATGQWIGHRHGQLVYGGGRTGLMGAVADACLQAGGRVIGIIPEALLALEVGHESCTELHVVKTMHERKQMMAERADVFLALAGGIGTFEELFEAWTWRQLGYHDKPIGVLNSGGYYDGLLDFLRSGVKQQFMNDWQMGLVQEGSDPLQLLPTLVQAAGLTSASRLQDI